jgi:hypothetical protein
MSTSCSLFLPEFHRRRVVKALVVLLAILGSSAASLPAHAQGDVGGGDAGGCTLANHVYTCDGAAFQKALASAGAVAIETHNADGVARTQLQNLVTKKLGKTVAPAGNAADLDFLLIPTSEAGVINGSVADDLGTLRVYTSGPDGRRGHLLWAENFSGLPDMPWPAVVRGLIQQFQARFKIK